LEKLLQVKRAVIDHMQRGLEGREGGLMMLPSFVDKLPREMHAIEGEEAFYAIDLGGTSLKLVWILVKKSRIVDQRKKELPIPEECYDTDNGKLLSWVVQCFQSFADNASSKTPIIGFCYSFACKQSNLDHGEQILWTKKFKGTGLLGKDVVQALRDEFSSVGIHAIIPALMNDSVASLVGAQFADPRVTAAVILGTGTNCSYIEHVNNIKTLPRQYRRHGDNMIVNTEWGDCALPSDINICVDEDDIVDRASANPGHGLFEKLIAGLYIGDVARLILGNFARENGMYGCHTIPKGSFNGAVLSAIYHDETEDLSEIGRLFQEDLRIGSTTLKERRTAKDVCTMVATRSARLCAAAMVAVVSQELKSDNAVISVDGSTFTKFPGYKELVESAVEEILKRIGPHRLEITVADGSSASGAAVCAGIFSDIYK